MTETARLYGGSLFQLAAEEGQDTQILAELDTVATLFKDSPEYLRLLSTPSLPKKERTGLLDEALLGELGGCARAYRVAYNKAHGILEATAVAAVALTAQQTQKLHDRLEQITGKQVDLQVKVDPAVLGGIRLDMDGVQLDGTVKNRLAALRRNIDSVTL